VLGQAVNDAISLKTYTYAFVCYVKAAHTFKDSTSGPLHDIIVKEIPLKTKDHLLPYEFSLLLHSINRLKRRKPQLEDKTAELAVRFPNGFKELLVSEFGRICKRQNVTLRNNANSFKEFSESFGFSETFVRLVISKINSIISEEIALARTAEKYDFNYKIDLLSLSSLTWKLA
jgi:hypothetical protein